MLIFKESLTPWILESLNPHPYEGVDHVFTLDEKLY
jgi:hypothetical protein